MKSERSRGGPGRRRCSLVRKEDFPWTPKRRSACSGPCAGSAERRTRTWPHRWGRSSQALVDDTLDLRKLMAGGGSEQEIARAAADRGLDEQVLLFLVRSSTRPSIEAASEKLRGGIDLESSRTGPLPRLRFPARPQSSERRRGNPVLPLLLVRLPVAGRPAGLLRLRQQGTGGAALFLRRGRGGPPHRPLRRLPSLHQDDRLPQPRRTRPFPGGPGDSPSRRRGCREGV